MIGLGLEDLPTCPGETPSTGSCPADWFAIGWCSKWRDRYQRDDLLTSTSWFYRRYGDLGGSAPEALDAHFTVFETVLLVRLRLSFCFAAMSQNMNPYFQQGVGSAI